MPLKTYFDFADNDYQFFISVCGRDYVANALGAIAQNICERYMKHLIDNFDVPSNPEDEEKKKKILSSHNLNHLFNYVQDNLNVEFSHDAKRKMRVINGFYFSARYPGEDSFELSQEDINDCIEAVTACRKETLELMEKLEKKPSLAETIESAEQRTGTVLNDAPAKENER